MLIDTRLRDDCDGTVLGWLLIDGDTRLHDARRVCREEGVFIELIKVMR